MLGYTHSAIHAGDLCSPDVMQWSTEGFSFGLQATV